MTNHSTLIIGGGLGGLFTGALLARNGCRVVVLEQLPTAGGGLQQFTRYGRTFATGMHVVGGLSAGESLRRLCTYLGIDYGAVTRPCDALCRVVLNEGETYTLPLDAQTRTDYLKHHFPAEAEHIDRYERALSQLTDAVEWFHLRRHDGASPFDFNEQLLEPADQFVARHLRTPQLQQLVQFSDLLFDARRGHSPAFVHAVISTLYRRDSAMPVMGAPTLAHLLTEVITRHGGEVRTHERVTHIDCTNRHITAVHTAAGATYTAHHYVATIAPAALLRLLPADAFPAAFSRRVQQMPAGISAFKVFYDLQPQTFRHINHPTYIYRSATPQFLQRWMFVTPPVAQQGAWAETLEAICPMPFDEVEPWAESISGHRPSDYDAWKEQHIEAVTEQIEQLHPGFRAAVRHAFAATPLTWRDWFGSTRGSMFGPLHDCLNPALTHLSVNTKIDNLYLGGQSINQHGICGTPLTAVQTAEAILGQGAITHQV